MHASARADKSFRPSIRKTSTLRSDELPPGRSVGRPPIIARKFRTPFLMGAAATAAVAQRSIRAKPNHRREKKAPRPWVIEINIT